MTGANEPAGLSVYLSEFETLRSEIETRATLSSSLVALELSALGIGLVAAKDVIDLYAGLGFLSAILWLFWLDHTEQIWKLATYISLRLRPALSAVAPDALAWEPFLRELDAKRAVRSTNYAARYITLLFAAIPPLLTAVFVASALRESDRLDFAMAARLVAAALVLALWAFALGQFRAFTRSRDQMDSWISDPSSY